MSIPIIDNRAEAARTDHQPSPWVYTYHPRPDARGTPLCGDDLSAAGQDQTAGVVDRLRQKLEHYQSRRARRAGWVRRFIPTELTPLDAALPHGGLPCGAITEIRADSPGVGAMSLAMRLAARCLPAGQAEPEGTRHPARKSIEKNSRTAASKANRPPRPQSDHRYLILMDTAGDFYPPAARAYGIPLDRLIVLRTRRPQDAFWAVDQSLRCAAVAAVIAPLARLDERRCRRLQLAAESSGCIGLILGPARRRGKSFAAVQLAIDTPHHEEVAPPSDGLDHHLCRITLLAAREGTPAGPLWVDLNHETGAWAVPAVSANRPAVRTA